MKLRTVSAAETDITSAAVWLEKQRAGLGNDFLDDIEAVFREIIQAPHGYPTLQLAHTSFRVALRWASAGRFSYLIFYYTEEDAVIVVAVLHAHRDLEFILRGRVGIEMPRPRDDT